MLSRLRHICLIVTLAFATTATAADKPILIHNGPQDIHLAGHDVLAVRAWRENYNAHGFDTVVLFARGDNGIWQVVPVMYVGDKGSETNERIEIGASGGADCLLRDFRLIPQAGRHARLIVAERDFGESFADSAHVHFDYYDWTENTDGDVGYPTYYFKHVKRVDAKKMYCDVNDAFEHELKLGLSSDGRSERQGD